MKNRNVTIHPPAAKMYSISFEYFAISRRGRGYAGFSCLGGMLVAKRPFPMTRKPKIM